ncbi:radical SAM protein [Kitasatospora sp. NPDC056783]|uniref:radical SAM protein n=1 Tax=Kitasatospora sp. NPDC056783 TaxID=3345943 RepID=UPI003686D509
MTAPLATSRYTLRVPVTEGYALFNTSTGSVMRFDGPQAEEATALLSGNRRLVAPDSFGERLTARLRRNGFLVDPEFDEVAEVRERYWTARGSAPAVLLVTTTMDCNLGCYYCYESRSSDALRVDDTDMLVALAAQRLGDHRKSLHVDWYGGEPLMNLDALERGSIALQEYCRERGIAYHASVVSNGTRWPEDPASFVGRHRIREVQITFDGMKDNHDRRRRYRQGYRREDDHSSFERAADLVDVLVRHTRVDVRFNADHGNADDLAPFIRFATARGWFDGPFRCVLAVARVSGYSDRSAFLRPHELDTEEFSALEETARNMLPPGARDTQDIVGGFPHPKTSVCGALAEGSAVVGADGLEYRCGLQVGERHRAVGRLRALPTGTLPPAALPGKALPLAVLPPAQAGAEPKPEPEPEPESFPDRSWWAEFDPTRVPSCSRCSFLPVCWGGCPKRHLDGHQVYLDAESLFWRRNLPRMITEGLGEPADGFEFTEADQFRDDIPAGSAAGAPGCGPRRR